MTLCCGRVGRTKKVIKSQECLLSSPWLCPGLLNINFVSIVQKTLVFQCCQKKGQTKVPDWYNRVLDDTKNTVKICFTMKVSCKFSSIVSNCVCGNIRGVTTLTLVDSGSPPLRITQSGWFQQNNSYRRYSSKMFKLLDDSWYFGIALFS